MTKCEVIDLTPSDRVISLASQEGHVPPLNASTVHLYTTYCLIHIYIYIYNLFYTHTHTLHFYSTQYFARGMLPSIISFAPRKKKKKKESCLAVLKSCLRQGQSLWSLAVGNSKPVGLTARAYDRDIHKPYFIYASTYAAH